MSDGSVSIGLDSSLCSFSFDEVDVDGGEIDDGRKGSSKTAVPADMVVQSCIAIVDGTKDLGEKVLQFPIDDASIPERIEQRLSFVFDVVKSERRTSSDLKMIVMADYHCISRSINDDD